VLLRAIRCEYNPEIDTAGARFPEFIDAAERRSTRRQHRQRNSAADPGRTRALCTDDLSDEWQRASKEL
jgi:hypothetical protein